MRVAGSGGAFKFVPEKLWSFCFMPGQLDKTGSDLAYL